MNLLRAIRHSARWTAARLPLKSERGASAVEYGIMVALIAAVVIVAVVFLGNKTSSSFSCTGQSIEIEADAC